jgi:hypothetical protein
MGTTALEFRGAFLNRRVATHQRVMVDFKRVVGLVENDYYGAFDALTSLKMMMKVLSYGSWRFFSTKNGSRSIFG